ncbi:syntaxin-17 [Strongylocentrotus purpuratus]|uniref:t-SNARE coiled-coil homology domain-containing protein n=1 Tax=Strongylocentrotus purpuratus TaxID=7668 RepID=A0A7M7N3B1_STRPU|nr:syntaxin-17 [Strongylocentrotus purpuratus]
MAEFGESPSCRDQEPTDIMKQPIKKLEPAINRFTKIAIPVDLERLANHCRNIQKFQQLQQWDKLRVEQINARRTVQQLKANVREMEKVRMQVCDDDQKTFDDQVAPVKEEVIQAVVKVIELCGVESSPLDPPIMTQSLTESLLGTDEGLRSRFRHTNSLEASSHSSSMESSDAIPEDLTQEASEVHHPLLHDEQQQQQQQTQEAAMPSEQVQESWDMLKNELVELNSLTHEFAAQVQAQQEQVDSIQNNIQVAQTNIQTGVKHLLKASTYKAAMLPIGGAILGGICGGPVGFVAGMKVGAAAAIGGGAIGFLSGRAIKKRQDKKIQMEMSVLTNGTLEGSVAESSKDK